LNFTKFFDKIKPRIFWLDSEGFWYCEGDERLMDKSEKELHWPQNCSLSKLNSRRKARQIAIADNLELYEKYCHAHGIKFISAIESKEEPFPLSWYENQFKNYSKLSMNISEPSGAAVEEAEPIPLRKLTPEDLIPKVCKKHDIVTDDSIIDAIQMKDEPFRDLDGNIIENNNNNLEQHKVDYTQYYSPQEVENMKDPIIKEEWDRQREEWLDKWEPNWKETRKRLNI
jgi:hypothetical protein